MWLAPNLSACHHKSSGHYPISTETVPSLWFLFISTVQSLYICIIHSLTPSASTNVDPWIYPSICLEAFQWSQGRALIWSSKNPTKTSSIQVCLALAKLVVFHILGLPLRSLHISCNMYCLSLVTISASVVTHRNNRHLWNFFTSSQSKLLLCFMLDVVISKTWYCLCFMVKNLSLYSVEYFSQTSNLTMMG